MFHLNVLCSPVYCLIKRRKERNPGRAGVVLSLNLWMNLELQVIDCKRFVLHNIDYDNIADLRSNPQTPVAAKRQFRHDVHGYHHEEYSPNYGSDLKRTCSGDGVTLSWSKPDFPKTSKGKRGSRSPSATPLSSKFIEGSMNDRASKPPPSNFLDYIHFADMSEEAFTTNFPGPQEETPKASGMYRFGSTIKRMNPLNALKSIGDFFRPTSTPMPKPEDEYKAKVDRMYAETKQTNDLIRQMYAELNKVPAAPQPSSRAYQSIEGGNDNNEHQYNSSGVSPSVSETSSVEFIAASHLGNLQSKIKVERLSMEPEVEIRKSTKSHGNATIKIESSLIEEPLRSAQVEDILSDHDFVVKSNKEILPLQDEQISTVKNSVSRTNSSIANHSNANTLITIKDNNTRPSNDNESLQGFSKSVKEGGSKTPGYNNKPAIEEPIALSKQNTSDEISVGEKSTEDTNLSSKPIEQRGAIDGSESRHDTDNNTLSTASDTQTNGPTSSLEALSTPATSIQSAEANTKGETSNRISRNLKNVASMFNLRGRRAQEKYMFPETPTLSPHLQKKMSKAELNKEHKLKAKISKLERELEKARADHIALINNFMTEDEQTLSPEITPSHSTRNEGLNSINVAKTAAPVISPPIVISSDAQLATAHENNQKFKEITKDDKTEGGAAVNKTSRATSISELSKQDKAKDQKYTTGDKISKASPDQTHTETSCKFDKKSQKINQNSSSCENRTQKTVDENVDTNFTTNIPGGLVTAEIAKGLRNHRDDSEESDDKEFLDEERGNKHLSKSSRYLKKFNRPQRTPLPGFGNIPEIKVSLTDQIIAEGAYRLQEQSTDQRLRNDTASALKTAQAKGYKIKKRTSNEFDKDVPLDTESSSDTTSSAFVTKNIRSRIISSQPHSIPDIELESDTIDAEYTSNKRVKRTPSPESSLETPTTAGNRRSQRAAAQAASKKWREGFDTIKGIPPVPKVPSKYRNRVAKVSKKGMKTETEEWSGWDDEVF
jgi:hypothetical protein